MARTQPGGARGNTKKGARMAIQHLACFLTYLHRGRSKTFEGGFDAPRFLYRASGLEVFDSIA